MPSSLSSPRLSCIIYKMGIKKNTMGKVPDKDISQDGEDTKHWSPASSSPLSISFVDSSLGARTKVRQVTDRPSKAKIPQGPISGLLLCPLLAPQVVDRCPAPGYEQMTHKGHLDRCLVLMKTSWAFSFLPPSREPKPKSSSHGC